MLKRIIYIPYYLAKTDWKKFRRFMNFARNNGGKLRFFQFFDMLISVLRYNIAPLDYYYFRFYAIPGQQRSLYAGTGFMYEFQLKMNPKGAREVLENKIMFLKHFRTFINRAFCTLKEIKSDKNLLEKMLGNSSGRIVVKGSHGQVGAEVEVIMCSNYTPESLIRYMEAKKYNLVEEYVVQHPALMELSPSGLNTIRIFTQLHKGKVDFLGARLRVSVNSPVDNMAAGNLAAPVDLATGVINGPGVYSDITKKDEEVHPVTWKSIIGFAVPHWNSVIELAEAAALSSDNNKSIGWDIAITEKGPELIEGNHNWCKLLWQLPVKKGLKKELERYI